MYNEDDYKIVCSICYELMNIEDINNGKEWTWSDEDAHKKCVINLSNYYCKPCGYYDMNDTECHECGKTMEELTQDIKNKLLK